MSNSIEYKDYIGSVEYSSEDKCFFGKLEMIDDLVTFEADNVKDLEKNFKNAVDEYIKTCEDLGRNPQKNFKGAFNVRVGNELHRKATKNAKKLGVSLNTYIKNLIAQDVNSKLIQT